MGKQIVLLIFGILFLSLFSIVGSAENHISTEITETAEDILKDFPKFKCFTDSNCEGVFGSIKGSCVRCPGTKMILGKRVFLGPEDYGFCEQTHMLSQGIIAESFYEGKMTIFYCINEVNGVEFPTIEPMKISTWRGLEYRADNPPSEENLNKLKNLIIENGISEEYFNKHFKLLYADKDIFKDGEWLGAYFLLDWIGWVNEIYNHHGGYQFSLVGKDKWYSLVMPFEAKYPLESFAPAYHNLKEVNIILTKNETEQLARDCVGEFEGEPVVQFGSHGAVPHNKIIFETQKYQPVTVTKDGETQIISSNETEKHIIDETYLYYAVMGKSKKRVLINLENSEVEFCGEIQSQPSFMTQMGLEQESSYGQARWGWNPIEYLFYTGGFVYIAGGIVILIILIIVFRKLKYRS